MAKATLAWVLLLALHARAQRPQEPPPPAAELRQRTLDKLLRAKTLTWTVQLEVTENASELLESLPEKQSWKFRVKGSDEAYWSPDKDIEFFYEEPTLITKLPGTPDRREFGPKEGACILNSLVKGGVVGWTLVHASFGFEYDRWTKPAWDVLEGRKAIVVDSAYKLNTPGSADPEVANGRVWIDAESGLPLQRSYSPIATHGAAAKRFRARERYLDWKLDEEIPDAAFRP